MEVVFIVMDSYLSMIVNLDNLVDGVFYLVILLLFW